VSRFGAFALAPTMDHIGPIARSARDAAAILTAIAGPDDHDPTTLQQSIPQDTDHGITAMRIGVDPAWNSDGVHAGVAGTVADAAETLRHLGAEIVDVKVPDCGQVVSDWMTLCSVEASIAHAATFPARRAEYGPVLASVLDAGHAARAGQVHQVELRRLALRGQFARLFTTVDLLLTPVHPFMPLTLDYIKTLGERPDLIADLQRYTAPFDLTGNPTITIPGRSSDTGLPIGVQLAASHQREDHLITVAAAFQDQTSFHRRHPIL
jgi:amidase